MENQKRLFGEIIQFNPEKLQAGGGSGFGLFIAKGITDLHGGDISVFSKGEGNIIDAYSYLNKPQKLALQHTK